MRIIFVLAAMSLLFLLNGCLIFNSVSYEITTEGEGGTAVVHFYDIRSNAQNPSEFEEDKDNLFSYMWKSDKFIDDMKREGKVITERELYLEDNILNGRITFSFSKITDVENIMLEDNFYYLTLPLEDSVITTNGEIIESHEYKRILWDAGFNDLKFQILGFSFDEERYRPLGIHFKSLQ
jgi:hypothetical protein